MVDYVVATCPTCGYFEASTVSLDALVSSKSSVLGKRDFRTTLSLEFGEVHQFLVSCCWVS